MANPSTHGFERPKGREPCQEFDNKEGLSCFVACDLVDEECAGK